MRSSSFPDRVRGRLLSTWSPSRPSRKSCLLPPRNAQKALIATPISTTTMMPASSPTRSINHVCMLASPSCAWRHDASTNAGRPLVVLHVVLGTAAEVGYAHRVVELCCGGPREAQSANEALHKVKGWLTVCNLLAASSTEAGASLHLRPRCKTVRLRHSRPSLFNRRLQKNAKRTEPTLVQETRGQSRPQSYLAFCTPPREHRDPVVPWSPWPKQGSVRDRGVVDVPLFVQEARALVRTARFG